MSPKISGMPTPDHPYKSEIHKAGQDIPAQVFQAIYNYILDKKSGNISLSFQEGRLASMKREDFTRF